MPDMSTMPSAYYLTLLPTGLMIFMPTMACTLPTVPFYAYYANYAYNALPNLSIMVNSKIKLVLNQWFLTIFNI